jgi:hypothetical protein
VNGSVPPTLIEADVGLMVIDSSVSEPLPVPDTGIESERDSGVSVSLFSLFLVSFISTLPLNVSLAVGVNLTTKLALSPGVRVMGMEGVLIVKSVPLTVALSTTSLLPPSAVIDKVNVALLPTATPPKLRL